jgi:tetratricopeptide (TPR) repeat protein
MNKRLEMLTQLVESGTADSFAHYALALEYKREKRWEEALSTFEALRQKDPSYLPMYYLAGQLLLDLERREDARGWFEQGITVAQQKGDGKTLRELETALEDAG